MSFGGTHVAMPPSHSWPALFLLPPVQILSALLSEQILDFIRVVDKNIEFPQINPLYGQITEIQPSCKVKRLLSALPRLVLSHALLKI